MPRAVEQSAGAIALEPTARWILVDYPAALPGWYPIKAIRRAQDWVAIDCGREAPYVVPATKRLWWSTEQPPAEWWKPW